MTDQWTKLWNDRYKNETYAYGIAPNDFLKNSWMHYKLLLSFFS
jgi:hypothetical protein